MGDSVWRCRRCRDEVAHRDLGDHLVTVHDVPTLRFTDYVLVASGRRDGDPDPAGVDGHLHRPLW